MRLSEATWPEADAAETDLAVLPVGSTEQHGPHAPLGTDTITAEAVASAGVARYPGEAVVAPALPFGIAEEHRRFAGTLWLDPDTFRAVLADLIASCTAHGWRRVVVVNGHGGNVDALREAAARASRHTAAYAVSFTWWAALDDLAMDHAGAVETGMIRHHRPELVREDQLAGAGAESADRWGKWVGGSNLAYDTDEFSDNGVVGDPTDGDAATGEDLTERAAGALAELLEAVAERELDDA